MMRPLPSIGSPRSRALSRASPLTPPLTRSPSTRPARARGATVVVPPARTATVSGHGPRSPARDRTIPLVKDARPVPLEAGVRVPSSGPGGEHVLPRHVHHRRWPSRPESSQAGECGRPRLCDPGIG